MKSRENIVFLGMMGSGKSSIGRLVSKNLNLNFFDIDQQIEKKLNMKISTIFKEKGEKFFRKFEEKITLEVLKEKNAVVSLGGGAFLNKNIRDNVLKKHLSFWLKWDAEILIKRIKNNSKRPIVNNLKYEDLINLVKKRSIIYSKALYNIKCNDLSKNQITNKIINIYETNKINK